MQRLNWCSEMNIFKVINKENATHTLIELKNLDTVSDLSKLFKRWSNPQKSRQMLIQARNSPSQKLPESDWLVLWVRIVFGTKRTSEQLHKLGNSWCWNMAERRHTSTTTHATDNMLHAQHNSTPSTMLSSYITLTSFYDLFLLFRLHTESLPQRQRMYREDLTVLRPASS